MLSFETEEMPTDFLHIGWDEERKNQPTSKKNGPAEMWKTKNG